MHWVGRRGDEIEFQIKAPRLFILRMHCKRPDASDVGRLKRAQHRVFEQRLAHALAVPAMVYGETREQHDGNRMARQTFGQALRRVVAYHMADSKSVIADDGIPCDTEICLGCACLLILPGVA